ncbi:MAG: SRPBCC family protein [Acidimicrobiia bacterium]
MARYVTTVRTPKSQEDAFAYLADLRNFAEWDPGVREAQQVRGDGPGPDAEYDVTVDAAAVRALTLRYRTIEFDPPRSITVKASSRLFTSLDRIDVAPDGDGARATYDAELTLNGPLGLFDKLLQGSFRKIGDRANRGLIRALDGEQV